MSTAFHPRELPARLIKRQGEMTDTAFALSIGITRQYLALIRRGSQLPSGDTLAKLGFEMVLRVKDTEEIMPLAGITKYLTAQQGDKTDAQRGLELGLSRQHYHGIKERLNAVPAPWALEKLGMEIMYRPLRKKAA